MENLISIDLDLNISVNYIIIIIVFLMELKIVLIVPDEKIRQVDELVKIKFSFQIMKLVKKHKNDEEVSNSVNFSKGQLILVSTAIWVSVLQFECVLSSFANKKIYFDIYKMSIKKLL